VARGLAGGADLRADGRGGFAVEAIPSCALNSAIRLSTAASWTRSPEACFSSLGSSDRRRRNSAASASVGSADRSGTEPRDLDFDFVAGGDFRFFRTFARFAIPRC
jgi:hypothetical protein